MLRRILRNSAWLFGAQTIAKAVAFFYTLFLARTLGVENFGLYITALAYFALISSVGDFGFNRFLIREGARDAKKLPQFLTTAVITRLVLSTVTIVIFALWIFSFDNDRTRSALSILAVLAMIPQSVALTFDAALISREKFKFSAIGILGLSLGTAILGTLFILGGYGVFGTMIALVLGEFIYVFVLSLLIFKSHINLLTSFAFDHVKEILKGSLPYALLGVLGLLYFRIDALLLTYLRGSYETGLYGAAYKFLESIIFIPSAISAASFPILSRMHDGDLDKIKTFYSKSLIQLFLISLPIFAGFILVLPIIVKIFLPQYTDSVQIIRILSLAIPFMFLHTPGVVILTSANKYLKAVLGLSIATMLFNVIGNLLLIPAYGLWAASWMTVASEVISFIIFYSYISLRVFKSVTNLRKDL